MKMIINVTDLGTNYLVNNIFIKDIVSNNDGFEKIEIYDTMLFRVIKEHLLKNETVRLPKNVNPLKPSDLIIGDKNDLNIAKDAAISEIQNIYNNRIGAGSNFIFYEFQLLNNILILAGYTLTNDNKEDRYLDILNKGDSTLIDALQKYLETQSKIEELDTLKKQVDDVLIQINDSISIEDIESNKNTFINNLS